MTKRSQILMKQMHRGEKAVAAAQDHLKKSHCLNNFLMTSTSEGMCKTIAKVCRLCLNHIFPVYYDQNELRNEDLYFENFRRKQNKKL